MASCKDRRKLAEQFAVAARQHSEAVTRLVQHEGTSSHTEYSALLSAANKTHERCDRAGVDFKHHVATHGCGVSANESEVAASAHVTASAGI